MSGEIAMIDFSGFYSEDQEQRQKVVEQIVGHGVPQAQSEAVMKSSKKFFALPQELKDQVSKDKNTWNRGYEMLRSQILEEGTLPELKEGFYIGDDISETHPYFVNKRLNSGPNQWPVGMDSELDEFKSASMDYYRSVLKLASDLLRVLALSLDLEESYFIKFMEGAVATMRLLHYPSQPKDADEKLSRGIGAHTDFGAITILLQDDVDGLQVWNSKTSDWIDVEPTKGAFVVNLGNLMQRWTNEKYKSNVHRVINKSGKERYSIPVFISGNPDYVVECIPTCKAADDPVKFAPVTVEEAVSAAYAESYGRAQLYKQGLEKKAQAEILVQPPAVAAA
ncbi:Clavaminate synthase-like protein [Thozetella sp. PMI_491]|nr:Clavaminate synthase-like protein [Thozetella sp. PMI_491]